MSRFIGAKQGQDPDFIVALLAFLQKLETVLRERQVKKGGQVRWEPDIVAYYYPSTDLYRVVDAMLIKQPVYVYASENKGAKERVGDVVVPLRGPLGVRHDRKIGNIVTGRVNYNHIR